MQSITTQPSRTELLARHSLGNRHVPRNELPAVKNDHTIGLTKNQLRRKSGGFHLASLMIRTNYQLSRFPAGRIKVWLKKLTFLKAKALLVALAIVIIVTVATLTQITLDRKKT